MSNSNSSCFYLTNGWLDEIDKHINDTQELAVANHEYTTNGMKLIRVNKIEVVKLDTNNNNSVQINDDNDNNVAIDTLNSRLVMLQLYDGKAEKWALLNKRLHGRVISFKMIDQQKLNAQKYKCIFETCVCIIDKYHYELDNDQTMQLVIDSFHTIGRAPSTHLCMPKATHTFAKLKVGMKEKWSVEAVLIEKTGLNAQGTCQRMLWRDKYGGTVEMCSFYAQNNRHDVQSLKLMSVYRIENCNVAWPKHECRVWSKRGIVEYMYDLHCVQETQFIELPLDAESFISPKQQQQQHPNIKNNNDVHDDDDDDDINSKARPVFVPAATTTTKTTTTMAATAASSSSYVTLDQLLFHRKKNDLVDVIGIVCKYDRQTHASGKAGLCIRRIYLTDESGLIVKCTFWGNEAKASLKQVMENGTICIFNNARVAEFNGIYLSKDFNTQFSIIKADQFSYMPEVVRLRSYWQHNSHTIMVDDEEDAV